MRGKPCQQSDSTAGPRNIPAYAGKTPASWPAKHTPAEHPRVCGENLKCGSPRANPKGTSPRMRGKRGAGGMGAGPFRNIPAYAGKTPDRRHPRHWIAEHPRVCGENPYGFYPARYAGGTSPRMRGKRGNLLIQPVHNRNIPAYAGKTPASWPAKHTPAEHPRVCGENLKCGSPRANPKGTSPRMRGKRGAGGMGAGPFRNIPAYAGKTPDRRHPRHWIAEHPRVCGENPYGFYPARYAGGTSPRMRGKRGNLLIQPVHNRNIPAYAGKTDIN